MDLGIKGRRAIVTGGGSGIGFETARQFLEEGVRVLIAGRTADKINKARDELAKRTGGEVHAVQADMSKEADIKRMIDTAKERIRAGLPESATLYSKSGTWNTFTSEVAIVEDGDLRYIVCILTALPSDKANPRIAAFIHSLHKELKTTTDRANQR